MHAPRAVRATALCALVAIASTRSSHAHGVLTAPVPRSTMGAAQSGGNGAKLTAAPATAAELNACHLDNVGTESQPGKITAIYAPGATVTVSWDITIAHQAAPGVRVALRDTSKGESFSDHILQAFTTTNADGIDVGSTTGVKTLAVTLPANLECECCQLQWIWESTTDGGFYVDCADITISSTATATPNLVDGQMCMMGGASSTAEDGGGGGGAAVGVLGAAAVIGAAGFAFYKKDEIKAKIDEKRNVPEGSLVTDEAPKPHVFGRVAPALPINRPSIAQLSAPPPELKLTEDGAAVGANAGRPLPVLGAGEAASSDSVEVAVDTTPAQPERIATALFNFEPSGHMDHIAMRKGDTVKVYPGVEGSTQWLFVSINDDPAQGFVPKNRVSSAPTPALP